MQRLIAGKKFNILRSNEAGVTLIETLIALALFGIIAVGLISGLATTFKAVAVGQDKMTAESLAKSQLEHIKTQDYISAAEYDPDNPEKCYALIDIPDDSAVKGYDIEITSPETITSPGGSGYELQSLTVAVKRNGEEILTVTDYKMGRTN